MSEQSRKLNFVINLDTGRVEVQAKQARESIAGIGSETARQGSRIADVFKGVGGTIAATFAIGRIKSFISEIINVRSEIQSLEVSFATLLGSETKAAELFGQIRQYVTSTPMRLDDLAQGAQTMLGFNIELEKVMPMLKSIGDISMGNRERFNSLTLAFSQMSATGKLMGQDLLQMINAGFNPLTEISAKTGKAMSTLKEEMSAGSVSAKMVEDAFKSATAEGGRFHGMLGQQSKALRGSLSNLQGAFTDMLNDFGKSSEDIIAGGVNAAYEMVKNYRETAEALLALIATAGVYKAALIAETAMQAAAADAAMARIGAIGQVNAAEAAGIELEVQKAVASGSVTKAQGEEIIATYALAKARVADLKQLAVHAQAELQQAITTERAAAAQVRAAEETVVAANMKYEAALRSGNAQKIETAELELGTAQAELNTASRAHNAALTNVGTASKKASIASTTAETAANELNTASLSAQSKATAFLTLAKTQLVGAARKLWATMAAHPLGLLLAAVTALGYGIYKLCTYQTDAEKAAKKMNEAHAQAQGAFMEEERQIKKLFDALKNAKEGTEAYKKAKEDIWSKYGNYLKALGDENTALKDQAAAYALVTKKAREAAMAKAKEAFLSSDDAQKLSENLGKTYLEAYKLIEKKYGSAYTRQHKDQIRRVVSGDTTVNPKLLEAFNEQTYTITGADYSGNPTWGYVQTNKLQSLIQKGRRQVKEINDLNEEAEIMFGSAGDPGKAEPEEPAKNYAAEVKAAQKRLSEARARYNRLKKSNTSTVPEVEDAEKQYSTAKEAYEKLASSKADGGGGKTPGEISAERAAALRKETDLQAAQLRERNRTLLRFDDMLQQSRLDILGEGDAKRQRQTELANARELAALYSQMDDEIKAEVDRQKALFDAREASLAAGNKHYAKRTFSSGDILATEWATDGNIGDGFNSGNVDTGAINSILARYDLLRKLLAKKQAKADEDRRRSARLSMQEYLAEYGTFEERKAATAEVYAAKIAAAANEAEKLRLMQEERQALADIEFAAMADGTDIAKAFGEVANLSRDTIDELIAALEQYRQKAADTLDPEKIARYEEALGKLYTARADNSLGLFADAVPAYFRERRALLQRRDSANAGIGALQGRQTALNIRANTLRNVIGIKQRQGQDASKEEGELAKVEVEADRGADALKKAKEAAAGLNDELNNMDDPARRLKALGESVSYFADLAGDAARSAASMFEGMGADKAAEASGAVAEIADTVGGIADGFANGGVIGGIAAAASAAMSIIGKIFAAGDAKKEKLIEKLQKDIDALEKVNSRLERRRGSEYSKARQSTYEEEIRNLERQQALIRQQIYQEQSKKNGDDERIEQWREQLEELGDTIADYKDAAIDAVIGEDISSSIDNFATALVDSWGAAADRARSTKDLVRSMLRQMVQEAMKTDLSEPVRRLRKMMEGAMDDDVVTDTERENLEQFAEQLGEQMRRKYEWADGIMSGDTAQQDATAGYAAQLSEDTGSEISGRMAALQMQGEARNGLLSGMADNFGRLVADSAYIREHAADMHELSLLAVGHLENISKNTSELYQINSRLEKIERNTRDR